LSCKRQSAWQMPVAGCQARTDGRHPGIVGLGTPHPSAIDRFPCHSSPISEKRSRFVTWFRGKILGSGSQAPWSGPVRSKSGVAFTASCLRVPGGAALRCIRHVLACWVGWLGDALCCIPKRAGGRVLLFSALLHLDPRRARAIFRTALILLTRYSSGDPCTAMFARMTLMKPSGDRGTLPRSL
jgi:hypothetical protein